MNKIKVAGYSKKIQYVDGIEYRPFSSGLVGNQFQNNNDSPLFTSGNFNITTNLEPKEDKFFSTNSFGNLTSLDDLKLTKTIASNILKELEEVKINFNKKELKNYAYFGSLKEFVRVSLENIIINWPASLFISPIDPNNPRFNGITFHNYVVNELKGESTFSINVNVINNNFNLDISYLNGSSLNNKNPLNDLRNLNKNFSNYVLSVDGIEYQIIDFIGEVNGYVNLKVSGQPFSGLTNTTVYHIKPNSVNVDNFFKKLSVFESYLLNNKTTPKFKSEFDYFVETEEGNLIKSTIEIIWPISDGYNIDFNSDYYIDFVNKLITISENSDDTKSNIISRLLVSNSILEFDTLDLKINKVLNIYGRQLDSIKSFIDGISNVYTVTYDGNDNVVDRELKSLAHLLGWNNLPFIDNSENNIEFYKKLIINTPWIWKSKGNRKSIEFILKLFGFPNGLVEFNEFIYVAKNKLDINLFNRLLENLNLVLDESINVDDDGFPRINPNNPDLYFQKGGLWIRETGGVNSKLDILTGNNPHLGPYDYGNEYINQFNCLIPSFSATTLINEDILFKKTNLFLNNQLGTFCDLNDNSPIVQQTILTTNNCPIVSSSIVEYDKTPLYDECGCIIESCKGVLKINFSPKPINLTCNYKSIELMDSGLVLFTLNDESTTYNFNSDCCIALGYTSELDTNGASVCRWKVNNSDLCKDFLLHEISSNGYQIFINTNGEFTKEIPFQECCPVGTTPELQANGNYLCKY
jgi:hypothetical protein